MADQSILIKVSGLSGGIETAGARPLSIATDRGPIETIWHQAAGAQRAVMCVGGVGGGLDGPVNIYPRLGAELPKHGLGVLRLAYRRPGDTPQCMADGIAGLEALRRQGLKRAALVGHSLGGEIVIRLAAGDPMVGAVVTIASHRQGALECVAELAPRPLLLIHGTADPVVPDEHSRQLYERAGEPKTLKLLPGADHVLSQVPEEAFRLIRDWLLQNFSANS